MSFENAINLQVSNDEHMTIEAPISIYPYVAI